LLKSVKGLEYIPLAEEDTCCGFGGTFSVIYPEISKRMMDQKPRGSKNRVLNISQPVMQDA
jgi:L-lactate dehydrogenase complex protein LldE